MQESGISLYDLNNRVKESLAKTFSEDIWIFGEISDIHTNSSGHCFMELIEKDKDSNKIVAKMRANIWAFTFRLLRPYFENTTGYQLDVGLKVLFKASVEFHEVFGISLNIKDINPEYTLGDIARKKREIIIRLTEEGIIDMNKGLEIALVPQRIAVISSETAAGYGDFMKSLSESGKDFRLKVELFPAVMQGEKTEESIITALEKIFQREDEFDIVVLIRGGGSQADLESFNNYNIAFHIAQFPLPVLSGIGHDRDETIVDIVANTSLKTPTAVAGFIVDSIYEFIDRLDVYQDRMESYVKDILSEENYYLQSLAVRLKTQTDSRLAAENSFLLAAMKDIHIRSSHMLSLQNNFINNSLSVLSKISLAIIKTKEEEISRYTKEIQRSSFTCIEKKKEELISYDKFINLMDPAEVMKRGFSIASNNGKVLRDIKALKKGDTIKTRLLKGEFESIIEKIN